MIVVPSEPPPPIWVYLDANVVRDLTKAFDPAWTPAADLALRARETPRAARTELQIMAAGRLFFYARRDRSPDRSWHLCVSGTVREELARGPGDWTLGVVTNVDTVSDAPFVEDIGRIADQLVGLGVRGNADAHHLARMLLIPYVEILVTNDKKLRRVGKLVESLKPLQVVDVIEGVAILDIKPGETPPTAPPPDIRLPMSSRGGSLATKTL